MTPKEEDKDELKWWTARLEIARDDNERRLCERCIALITARLIENNYD
jgi:hypothetical protein